jgi:hypothetical protein
MLDDLIGISAIDNSKEGSAQFSDTSLDNHGSYNGLGEVVSGFGSRALSFAKSKFGVVSKTALAGLAALGLYSIDVDTGLVSHASGSETYSAGEASSGSTSGADEKPEKCTPRITNDIEPGVEDSKPSSVQSIFVNPCGEDDLDVRMVTDLRKVSRIKSKVNTAGDDLVFKFKFDPKNWGFGSQRYERKAVLVDGDGKILDTWPRIAMNNSDEPMQPFFYDIKSEGAKAVKALSFASNVKFGFNYLWYQTIGSDVPFSKRNVPTNAYPGFGVNFASTNFSLAFKISGRKVNDETWFTGVYINQGTSYKNGALGYDVGLIGGWQFTADTVRRVKFGMGAKIGYNNNGAFAFDENSSMSALDAAIVFFGDELSNGPFKKPFDDIEYQLTIGGLFSNFDETAGTPSTELYLNANLEAMFDFSKVGSSHLFGLVLNGHYVPLLMAGNVPESFTRERQAIYNLSAGLKSRLELPALHHTRFDFKLMYSLGQDKFNGYNHGAMLFINAEY